MAAEFDAIDVLLSATLGRAAGKGGPLRPYDDGLRGLPHGPEGIFAYSPFCAVFNASGQPAASLPLGWSGDGLPIGIHLAAAFGADELLISLCAEVERAGPWAGKRAEMAQ